MHLIASSMGGAQQARAAASLGLQDTCSSTPFVEATRVQMPAIDAQEASCSTSSPACGSMPAFLERRNLFTSSGLLMLKSLTYAELERWCIHIGARCASSKDLHCYHGSATFDSSCH